MPGQMPPGPCERAADQSDGCPGGLDAEKAKTTGRGRREYRKGNGCAELKERTESNGVRVIGEEGGRRGIERRREMAPVRHRGDHDEAAHEERDEHDRDREKRRARVPAPSLRFGSRGGGREVAHRESPMLESHESF